MAAVVSLQEQHEHPLDKVEQLASEHNWSIERAAEDEINMIVEGSWSDLHLCPQLAR